MGLQLTPLASAALSIDGYVILGGGVCGCLLAHQLITLTDAPVWIIEAGKPSRKETGLMPDKGSQPCNNVADRQRPARWLHLLGGGEDDSHWTLPSRELAYRKLAWPRGCGVGGSGRINAMIWMPPSPSDFQSLADAGLQTSRLIKASEMARELFAIESPRYLSPQARDFLSAMEGSSDFGRFFAFERINRRGRRWTTEDLLNDLLLADPTALNRLHVVKARVRRAHFRNHRVVQLELADEHINCTIEVGSSSTAVACTGALATPAFLMRSGIGNAEVLRRLNIQPVVNLDGIGRNLHDHLIMPLVYAHGSSSFPSEFETRDIARWQYAGAGPLSSNIAECGGFSSDERFQLHVTPTDYLRYPHGTNLNAAGFITLGVNQIKPLSRGQVRLNPASPIDEKPLIETGYLECPTDANELIQGTRWARAVAGNLSGTGFIGEEKVPGTRRADNRSLAAAISRYAQTLYHPGGTCALGDAITPQFGVPEIDNLHVVDASLLPVPTSGNPTATLAMLACYASQTIAANH